MLYNFEQRDEELKYLPHKSLCRLYQHCCLYQRNLQPFQNKCSILLISLKTCKLALTIIIPFRSFSNKQLKIFPLVLPELNHVNKLILIGIILTLFGY